MNAVERAVEYAQLPSEGDFSTKKDPSLATWPSGGEIKFTDVAMRYRDGLPLVLKDVNFTINAGEKVTYLSFGCTCHSANQRRSASLDEQEQV
jgi:ABC-type multidrug transport system fused ATPase/permease subunit